MAKHKVNQEVCDGFRLLEKNHIKIVSLKGLSKSSIKNIKDSGYNYTEYLKIAKKNLKTFNKDRNIPDKFDGVTTRLTRFFRVRWM